MIRAGIIIGAPIRSRTVRFDPSEIDPTVKAGIGDSLSQLVDVGRIRRSA
jgi:hypothetical protein